LIPYRNYLTLGIVGIRGLLVVATIVLVAGSVRADPEAEKLFRDGRALIKDGKISEACDAFAASSRLEPSVGTLLNLGACRAKLGKTATAWAAFSAAADLAKRQRDKRQAEADRRTSELEPKLSYITIQIDAAARVAGLKLVQNGIAVDDATIDHAKPLDPGDYDVRANAPGYLEWSAHIKLGPDGDRKTIVVTGLHKSESTAPPPKPAPLTAPEPAPAPQPEVAATPHTFTPMRTGAVVAAGGGVIALGISTVLALQAKSLYNEAHTVCPGSTCGDMAASQKSRDAVGKANVATVVGGVGIAAIGVGVVLWFVGKPHESESTRVVPAMSRDAAGVSIVGSF
jgi:hypothetical protein